jgi:hypothetical protein
VLGATVKPTKRHAKLLKWAARELAKRLPRTDQLPLEEVPELYGGAKKLRYQFALETVLRRGLHRADAFLKMFVKMEKLPYNTAKPNPDPRAIQFRSFEYGILLKSYVYHIEEKVKTFVGSGPFPPTRLIGKGLNMTERAMLLVEKLARFTSPVVLSLDISRFDKNYSVAHLEAEHIVYKTSNPSPELNRLLDWQIHNKGFSSTGIRYSKKGGRASGDMTTALGNCIGMILSVVVAMRRFKGVWDLFDDGDDCLVIVEAAKLERAKLLLVREFSFLGMPLKVEGIAHTIEDVEWCQSRPIEYQPGQYKFVRNPQKVLSVALAGTKYFYQPTVRPSLVYTIGLCELILNRGVPILQEWALALMRNAGTEKILSTIGPDSSMMARTLRELRAHNLKMLAKVDPLPISEVSRLSYANAFGVDPLEQEHMEAFFRNWKFDLYGDTDEPTIEVGKWYQPFDEACPECHLVV